MPRISALPPPAPLTGLELTPLVQGGGADAGVGVPIMAYATQPRGAVHALRRTMAADLSSTAVAAPAAGEIRWNNADPDAATVLVISDVDGDAASLAAALANLEAGALVYVQGKAAEDDPDSSARENLQKWQVTSVATGTGYVAITGTVIASSGDMLLTDALELSLQGPNPSPGYDRGVVTVVESDAGVTQIDASLGDYFVTTLTENTELQVINGPAAGTISLRVMQGAGGHTVSLPAGYLTQGGTPIAVSSAAGARDRIVITSDDSFATADVDVGKDYK